MKSQLKVTFFCQLLIVLNCGVTNNSSLITSLSISVVPESQLVELCKKNHKSEIPYVQIHSVDYIHKL